MKETNPDPKFAWRDIAHAGLPKRSAAQRVSDFLEIYGVYDEQTARDQASRCVQCPNPTCVGGCPLCNPIPQWMQLTAEGRFLEAAAVLGSVTTLAEICSRVCHEERMCEGACILNGVSEPVAIRDLEQFLVEYAAAHGHSEAVTAPPNGLRVVIVGSGAGGLACADELAKHGYAVTVMDSTLVPGGLLVNGMPAFNVERSIVERRIEILRRRGVTFRLGENLAALSLSELRSQFDAVYLGMDARQARSWEVPGASLEGIVQALAFLLRKTTPVALETPPIDVARKTVLVIGAGDTAMDCARTAVRYGAAGVTCVYRRSERDMPCRRKAYADACEEGVRFIFHAMPVAALADSYGRVRAVRCVRTMPAPAGTGVLDQPGTEFELEADWVLLALGFSLPSSPLTGEFRELKCDARGGLLVDVSQMTSMPRVYAGGDIVRGPCHVLDAVRDARNAAAAIYRRGSSAVRA